jgi:hypothetical protein
MDFRGYGVIMQCICGIRCGVRYSVPVEPRIVPIDASLEVGMWYGFACLVARILPVAERVAFDADGRRSECGECGRNWQWG